MGTGPRRLSPTISRWGRRNLGLCRAAQFPGLDAGIPHAGIFTTTPESPLAQKRPGTPAHVAFEPRGRGTPIYRPPRPYPRTDSDKLPDGALGNSKKRACSGGDWTGRGSPTAPSDSSTTWTHGVGPQRWPFVANTNTRGSKISWQRMRPTPNSAFIPPAG